MKTNHVKSVRRRPKPRQQLSAVASYMNAKAWNDLERSSDNSALPDWFHGSNKRKKKQRRKTAQLRKLAQKEADDSESMSHLDSEEDISICSEEEFDASETVRSMIFDLSLESGDDPGVDTPALESMFEKSVKALDKNEESNSREHDMVLHGVALSTSCVEKFARGGKNKTMYKENLPTKETASLLVTQPNTHKRCTLHIRSAHHAVCTLVQPEGKLTEIEICGRSKCGKNFTEDEVVVKVLNNTSPNYCKDAITNGQVIGRLNRKRFPNIAHPVFVCELDEHGYHHMIPLDKTVPKINVSHRKNNENKFQVELFKYDHNTQNITSSELVEIKPAIKHSYVFLVVYLRWDSVYPLGAVIKVMKTDGKINTGLEILELKYQIPTIYRTETVNSAQRLMQELNQEVPFTGKDEVPDDLPVFTIDPQNSKDLDDALSVRTLPNGEIEVGVHVADVATCIPKGDAMDQEALDRSTTFYQGQGKQAYHMLPEPISHNYCSLLPNKRRRSISTFFRFSPSGKLIDELPRIKRTTVVSRRQLSYQEVQDHLLKDTKREGVFDEIQTLFDLSKKLRYERLGASMHSSSLNDCMFESVLTSGTEEAHHLVEEFMILYNRTAAKYVCSKYPDLAILRCQDAPPAANVQHWLTKYPQIADIIMKLQNTILGKNEHNQRALKLENAMGTPWNIPMALQSWVWSYLCQCTKEGDFTQAWRLIGCDDLHPEQALAWNEWRSFQECAKYKRHDSKSDGEKALHFALGISPYVHATSPIRRYADVVNQRFIHAALDNQPPPYTKVEIEEICIHLNEASKRSKAFENQCKALRWSHDIRKDPVMVNGFIEDTTDQYISLYIPGMVHLKKRCREVALKLLNVARKPHIMKDVSRPLDILTLAWQKRIYSNTGFFPYARRREEVRISPHRNACFQQFCRWTDMLEALVNKNETKLRDIMSLSANYYEDAEMRNCVPACTSTVEDVSCENKEGVMPAHACKFTMSFNHAQILPVQIGADSYKGVLEPCPQLVELTKNVTLCLQHPKDPVRYLSRYATESAKRDSYTNVDAYLETWLPLVWMEAATTAVRESVTITDIPVQFRDKGGTFALLADFCVDRNITFSNMSMESILNEDEGDEKSQNTKKIMNSDFLCFKCPYVVDLSASKSPKGSPGGRRIWLAHGQVHQVRKNKETEAIEVHFLLHPSSPELPLELRHTKRKPRCSVEIMSKPASIRRPESALQCLKKASGLAQAVALGKPIPQLDKAQKDLARRLNTNNVKVPSNPDQEDAVKEALFNRFTLVQGPPGTGKTYTGIKILYLFTEINRKKSAEEGTDMKQVVFCGPSNKSVDHVASTLMRACNVIPGLKLTPKVDQLIEMFHQRIYIFWSKAW